MAILFFGLYIGMYHQPRIRTEAVLHRRQCGGNFGLNYRGNAQTCPKPTILYIFNCLVKHRIRHKLLF